MKRSGLSGIDELAAGLGHGRSLGAQALRENRIGRNLGSDLSEGWVSEGGGAKNEENQTVIQWGYKQTA